MKIVTILFVSLTLLLSISPCCAEKDNCQDEFELTCYDHHTGDGNNDRNACFPYNTCGICNGMIAQSQDADIRFYKPEIITFNSIYLFRITKGFDTLPLKPPITI